MSNRVKYLIRILNAFCPGQGAKDNSCSPFREDKFRYGELAGGGLTGDRLRNLMHPDNPRRNQLLETIAGMWSNDDTNAKLRRTMSDLARMTVPGGLLEHLHPGPGTYYRGGESRGVRSTAASFSRDRKYARMFGKIISVTIGPETPAIDLDKMNGGGTTYKEVLIDVSKLVTKPSRSSRHV